MKLLATTHRTNEYGTSKHPSSHPVDASNYQLKFLKQVLTKKQIFAKHLDFMFMNDKEIESLFVTATISARNNNDILYPPLALCCTATQVREFYRAGPKQQQETINKYYNYVIHGVPRMYDDDIVTTALQNDVCSVASCLMMQGVPR